MTKRLFKYFIFFFLLIFLTINWEKISWIFNYKGLSLFFSNFFSNPKSNLSKEKMPMAEKEPIEKLTFEFSEKEDTLEIPRIAISAPIFLAKSNEEKKILELLKRGVVMFSDYALPGQPGQTIILGHSAQHDWPKSNPAWVFTYLRDVEEEDEIILHFNHRKYQYLVEKKFILKEGETIPSSQNENVLFLVTCWPPGRLRYGERLIIEARLFQK